MSQVIIACDNKYTRPYGNRTSVQTKRYGRNYKQQTLPLVLILSLLVRVAKHWVFAVNSSVSYQLTGQKSNPIFSPVKIPYTVEPLLSGHQLTKRFIYRTSWTSPG